MVLLESNLAPVQQDESQRWPFGLDPSKHIETISEAALIQAPSSLPHEAFYPNTPFGLPAPDDMKVDTAGSTELVPPEYAPPLPALSNADLAYLEIESMAPGDMDSEVTETNALIVSEDPRFSAHILTLRETTRIQGDAQSSLAQVADDNQLATNELRVVTARELRSLSEAAHSSSELYRQLESRLSIVQQDLRLSNESLALRRVFTKHDRQSQARLDESFRRLAEQTEANKCLNDLVATLVADQSSLVGRVQSLDSRLEEERFKRESSSPKSKPADKPPPVSSAAFPSNDFYVQSYSLQWILHPATGTFLWLKTASRRQHSHAKYGLYEWLVMPFGLCNAVPCFERLMEHIPIDHKWRTCLLYLDDCIVYSEDFGPHLVRLGQVLSKFPEAVFKLKMSKCKWGRSSVPFLGHIVTPAGLLPNP
ncbi:hypothetical protein AeMF1_002591 [Aphanomyces euteiches]|nr:hypothetical protein AeMF1_002591 [Aphanomyces euteiches]KAH9188776.1 hypothetical protein AeNC1_009250 [Aphanomyces euteiches]